MKIKHQALSALTAASLLAAFSSSSQASTIFFSGNLRTDANVTGCGTGCTLGDADSDSDFAQWAAVVKTFTVTQKTTMEAITYSSAGGTSQTGVAVSAGGTSQTGVAVSAGGLEPYLSLFDSSGNFLAFTYFGTTCPAGAASLNGNCFEHVHRREQRRSRHARGRLHGTWESCGWREPSLRLRRDFAI
jgi:hypothetical protein